MAESRRFFSTDNKPKVMLGCLPANLQPTGLTFEGGENDYSLGCLPANLQPTRLTFEGGANNHSFVLKAYGSELLSNPTLLTIVTSMGITHTDIIGGENNNEVIGKEFNLDLIDNAKINELLDTMEKQLEITPDKRTIYGKSVDAFYNYAQYRLENMDSTEIHAKLSQLFILLLNPTYHVRAANAPAPKNG